MREIKASEFEKVRETILGDPKLSLEAKGLFMILFLKGEVDFKRLSDPEHFKAFNELLDASCISLELSFNI